MNSIGTYSQTNGLLSTLSGLVEQPLLKFTKGNFLFHPTTMIRMDFLKKNALKYENCPYAEDFKFWVEIAKSGGRFYIDSQPLLYYRISDSQVIAVFCFILYPHFNICPLFFIHMIKKRYREPRAPLSFSSVAGSGS